MVIRHGTMFSPLAIRACFRRATVPLFVPVVVSIGLIQLVTVFFRAGDSFSDQLPYIFRFELTATLQGDVHYSSANVVTDEENVIVQS